MARRPSVSGPVQQVSPRILCVRRREDSRDNRYWPGRLRPALQANAKPDTARQYRTHNGHRVQVRTSRPRLRQRRPPGHSNSRQPSFKIYGRRCSDRGRVCLIPPKTGFVSKLKTLLITRMGAAIGKTTLFGGTSVPFIAGAYLIEFGLGELVNEGFVLAYFLSPAGQRQLVGGGLTSLCSQEETWRRSRSIEHCMYDLPSSRSVYYY